MGNKTMTILNHTLGFPRVGLKRELKKHKKVTGQATPRKKNCSMWVVNCAPAIGNSNSKLALI